MAKGNQANKTFNRPQVSADPAAQVAIHSQGKVSKPKANRLGRLHNSVVPLRIRQSPGNVGSF